MREDGERMQKVCGLCNCDPTVHFYLFATNFCVDFAVDYLACLRAQLLIDSIFN